MVVNRQIIYVAPSRSSFVLQDIDYLNRKYSVTPFFFLINSKWTVPLKVLQLVWSLIWAKGKVILVSFGGYHSFVATLVAKLQSKKCYIILNGTDCACIPEFGYGHLRGGLLKWCCLRSYQWATKLLPVSQSLLETTNGYAFDPEKHLGLTTVMNPKSVRVISNGFDTNFWKRTSKKEPETHITVSSNTGLQLKGIDLFIQLARSRPNEKFKIAGMTQLKDCPANVELLGYLNREALRDEYSKATYFFQLSIWEGFGCALCEAMLCGCIPVVSEVNILPEIVGEEGLVLKKRDKDELIALLSEIDESADNQRFRDRIIDSFSIEKRIGELVKTIEED